MRYESSPMNGVVCCWWEVSKRCKCKNQSDDFEMRDWKTFDDPCNALPRCLEQDNGFSERVALPFVFNFDLSRHGE